MIFAIKTGLSASCDKDKPTDSSATGLDMWSSLLGIAGGLVSFVRVRHQSAWGRGSVQRGSGAIGQLSKVTGGVGHLGR